MKYRVITSNVVATEYDVEANSKEEAEEKFAEGTWDNCRDLTDYEIDSEEQVLEIELAECVKCGKPVSHFDYGVCPNSDLHRVSE